MNNAVTAAMATKKNVVRGSLRFVFMPRYTQNATAPMVSVQRRTNSAGSDEFLRRVAANQTMITVAQTDAINPQVSNAAAIMRVIIRQHARAKGTLCLGGFVRADDAEDQRSSVANV